MSRCNFCSLQGLKKEAKVSNLKVTLIKASYSLGGLEVYVHPKDVKKPKGFVHTPGSTEGFDQYWKMWVMGISSTCCC